MLKPNAQQGNTRRWGLGRCIGHEIGALVNEISAFIKETSQASLVPSHHVRTWREHSHLWTWNPHQTLNLPVPQAWTSQPPGLRNKPAFYKPPGLRYFIIAAWTDWDINSLLRALLLFPITLRAKKVSNGSIKTCTSWPGTHDPIWCDPRARHPLHLSSVHQPQWPLSCFSNMSYSFGFRVTTTN